MSKLKEILTAEQEREEVARDREREKREPKQPFLENIRPFLAHIGQTPEIRQVVEDLVLLARQQRDIPKIVGVILHQGGGGDTRDGWSHLWDTREDKFIKVYWEKMGNPKEWLSNPWALERERKPIGAIGFRIYWGHYEVPPPEPEGYSTPEWSYYVDILSQRNNLGQFYLLVRSGPVLYRTSDPGKSKDVLQEVKIKNPSLLDEAVADIYLKSLKPQKGKV